MWISPNAIPIIPNLNSTVKCGARRVIGSQLIFQSIIKGAAITIVADGAEIFNGELPDGILEMTDLPDSDEFHRHGTNLVKKYY